MTSSCPHCEKSFTRKDSMKRQINNGHGNPGHFTPFNVMPYSSEKCQRFQFENPFTCMVAGMTGSGKTKIALSLYCKSTQKGCRVPVPKKLAYYRLNSA